MPSKQEKSLKRKAALQGNNDNDTLKALKLIRSNSSSAIPVVDSGEQDPSSQTSNRGSSQWPNRRISCANCCLGVDGPGDDFFTCDVCGEVYHDYCLDDFDSTILDIVHEVMKIYGWICSECRNLAKSTKSSKTKSKKKGPAVAEDPILQQLRDEVGGLGKRIQSLETKLQELNVLVSSQPLPPNGPVVSDAIVAPTNKPIPSPSSKSIPSSETITTVHKVLQDAERRKCNLVVSGLRPLPNVDDCTIFMSLCERHFSIKPGSIKCRRIDKTGSNSSNGAKPSRLLVYLGSEKLASEILSQSRQLRLSDDHDTRLNVYISRDLSPEESKLAFEERARRRAKKQSPAALSQIGSTFTTSVPSTASPNFGDQAQFPPLPASSSHGFQSVFGTSQCAPSSLHHGIGLVDSRGACSPHTSTFNNLTSNSYAYSGSGHPLMSIHPTVNSTVPFIPLSLPVMQPIMHHPQSMHGIPSVQPGNQAIHLYQPSPPPSIRILLN